MNQPPLDFEAARRARDEGIARAVDHADAVTPKWSELAYAFLADYARRNATFTSEDVRAAAVDQVPEPPDLRAWGGVFQRASRARLIAKQEFTIAKDPKVHCSYMVVWRSAVCETYQVKP